MPSVAIAPPPAKQSAPRIVRLHVQKRSQGRRVVAADDPVSLTRELILRAIDRFEDARAFDLLARVRAVSSKRRGIPARAEDRQAWEALMVRTDEAVATAEAALAYLIDDAFNALAPPGVAVTHAEEIERERVATGPDRFIRRGFEVDGVAYLLKFDVGNLGPGIIARIEP